MKASVLIFLVFFSCSIVYSQVSGTNVTANKYSGITVGFGLGLFSPVGAMKDDYNPQFTYGLNADYRLNKNLTTGIEFLYTNMGGAEGSASVAKELYYINPNIKYKLWLIDEKTSFYLQAGPGFYGTSSYSHSVFYTSYSITEYRFFSPPSTKLGFHAGAGFDIYLGKIVSLNFNSQIHNYYDTKNNSKPMQFVTGQIGLKFKVM